MERIRVLIADDEPDLRQALADLLGSEDAMEVVGLAGTAPEAVELAQQERPDVAILDVKMPGGSAQAAKGIRVVSPQTRTLALSAYDDRQTVMDMLRAGVVGYVVKGSSSMEILQTVRRSVRGQGSLSVEVTADVINELSSLLERSESMARELAELNRTKSELIQVLSHELPTPVTVIQGFALTLGRQGHQLDPSTLEELAEAAARAGERIRRLVGNLGAAASLDREGVELATQPIASGELLTLAASEFTGHRDRLLLPSDPKVLEARIWGDPGLAPRALALVIENALALSPEEQPVDIELRVERILNGGTVDFRVSDRGPGVPAGMETRIFDAFSQADASTTREHGGIGIGLYLARRIMQAHGGSIELQARPGGGSTFVLAFPAHYDPDHAG